jgi:hypothetical protein
MHPELRDLVDRPGWEHAATLAAMSAGDQAAPAEAVERAEAWLDFAERNQVGPLVAHALRGALPSGHPAAARAAKVHARSADRMRILLGELDRIADRLAGDGIAVVALKNAGIARGIYPCAACCPMGDIDVLIDRDRFVDAHRLMLDGGYQLASRSSIEPADLEHGLASGGTEYLLESGGHEVWVELQWRPVAGRWIRRDQEPAAADLLARSVEIPGTQARLLAPEDNMVQVALHTAKHSYVRPPGLRLHTDVDRLARLAAPDWDRVAAMVEALQTTTAVYVSLAMARALLGAPVPEAILDRLAPAGWKTRVLLAAIRRAGVFEPGEAKLSRPEMMLFHALLYDDARGLLASALDTEPASVMRLGALPGNLRRGARRLTDLVRRYER